TSQPRTGSKRAPLTDGPARSERKRRHKNAGGVRSDAQRRGRALKRTNAKPTRRISSSVLHTRIWSCVYSQNGASPKEALSSWAQASGGSHETACTLCLLL